MYRYNSKENLAYWCWKSYRRILYSGFSWQNFFQQERQPSHFLICFDGSGLVQSHENGTIINRPSLSRGSSGAQISPRFVVYKGGLKHAWIWILISSSKIYKYYLVFVRFRTVTVAIQLPDAMTLLLGLDIIFLELLFDVTFPECFWSQFEIFLGFVIGCVVNFVNEWHSSESWLNLKGLK